MDLHAEASAMQADILDLLATTLRGAEMARDEGAWGRVATVRRELEAIAVGIRALHCGGGETDAE